MDMVLRRIDWNLMTYPTYTFKCDNKQCKKSIICLLSNYDDSEYFGKCSYCKSGRLKLINNIDLKVLK